MMQPTAVAPCNFRPPSRRHQSAQAWPAHSGLYLTADLTTALSFCYAVLGRSVEPLSRPPERRVFYFAFDHGQIHMFNQSRKELV
jgi:hypothetical protein